MRFRCPPVELPYWARTFFGFGPQAHVRAPAELRDMVCEQIRSTAVLYAVEAPFGDRTVSPLQE